MERKLVSLRVDKDALLKLDFYMPNFRYWKKHAIMCAILEHILLTCDSSTILRLIRWNRNGEKKLNITVTIE